MLLISTTRYVNKKVIPRRQPGDHVSYRVLLGLSFTIVENGIWRIRLV